MNRPTSHRIFALASLLIVMLPYAAPSVCGVMGRMGGDMKMDIQADDGLQSSSPQMTCCTLNECGIPYAAPTMATFSALFEFDVVMAEPIYGTEIYPVNELIPLTPPPKA